MNDDDEAYNPFWGCEYTIETIIKKMDPNRSESLFSDSDEMEVSVHEEEMYEDDLGRMFIKKTCHETGDIEWEELPERFS